MDLPIISVLIRRVERRCRNVSVPTCENGRPTSSPTPISTITIAFWCNLMRRFKKTFYVVLFLIKTHFNVFFILPTYLFLRQLKYTLFEDYFLKNLKRKYTWLSIQANIYLTICNIGSVLHWLNYSIKVSAERWPYCHVQYCFISSFSIGPKWFCKQRFYSTFWTF